MKSTKILLKQVKSFFISSHWNSAFISMLFLFVQETKSQIVIQDPERISTVLEICSKEQIILSSRIDSALSYQWEIQLNKSWISLGNQKNQVYAPQNTDNFKFRVKSITTDSIYSDTIEVHTVLCCVDPINGAELSRKTIYLDDFGRLDPNDITGNTFLIYDYSVPENPRERSIIAHAPFRRKLDPEPMGTTFSSMGAIPENKYAVVANMTSENLEWSNNITGQILRPENGFDHSGTREGAALLINLPDQEGVIYTREFANLCLKNSNKIFFECYITVFTPETNGVDISVNLKSGENIIVQRAQANAAGKGINGGKWVRIAAEIEIENNSFTFEIINNSVLMLNGNDLVLDDIRISQCVPPSLPLVFDNTLNMDSAICKEATFNVIPSVNLKKYNNGNGVFLYQYSLNPTDITSWKNLSSPTSAEQMFIEDINVINDTTLRKGDIIYLRSIAGSEQELSSPPLNGFQANDPCRNYSVSNTLVVRVACSSVTGNIQNKDKRNRIAFPNPAKEMVYLENNAKYKVMSVLGVLLLEGEGNTIDISLLEKGVYQLVITHSDGLNDTQKIFIE